MKLVSFTTDSSRAGPYRIHAERDVVEQMMQELNCLEDYVCRQDDTVYQTGLAHCLDPAQLSAAAAVGYVHCGRCMVIG